MADRYNIQIGEKGPNVYKLPSTPSLQLNDVSRWNLMFSSLCTKLVVEGVFNLKEPTVCIVKLCGKPHFLSLFEAGRQRKRGEVTATNNPTSVHYSQQHCARQHQCIVHTKIQSEGRKEV